jgi:hypothetical protein
VPSGASQFCKNTRIMVNIRDNFIRTGEENDKIK